MDELPIEAIHASLKGAAKAYGVAHDRVEDGRGLDAFALRPGCAGRRGPQAALVTRRVWRYSQGMLDWSRCEAVERDPGKLDGAWIFKGTRVPVRALFENLEDGATIDQFLEWFPGVPRCHVEVVLEHVARSLTESYA